VASIIAAAKAVEIREEKEGFLTRFSFGDRGQVRLVEKDGADGIFWNGHPTPAANDQQL